MNNTNTPPKPFKPDDPIYDLLGQEIKVGSILIYAFNLGRCAALKFGKVVKKTIKADKWGVRKEPQYRITIIGVEKSFYDGKYEVGTKAGTLQFPDRMIVIGDSQLPIEVKTIFDKV